MTVLIKNISEVIIDDLVFYLKDPANDPNATAFQMAGKIADQLDRKYNRHPHAKNRHQLLPIQQAIVGNLRPISYYDLIAILKQ